MSMRIRRYLMVAGSLLVIGGLLAACGGGDEDRSDVDASSATVPAGDAADPANDAVDAGPTIVNVVMEETEEAWAFALDRTEVPAGEVTFEVSNEGKFEHELMVYPAQDLSHLLDELVAAAETGEEDAHEEEEDAHGEEEDAHGEKIEGLVISLAGEDELVLEPNESGSFTTNLTPGTYELGCVIVETIGGETFTHHEKGMHTTLMVQ